MVYRYALRFASAASLASFSNLFFSSSLRTYLNSTVVVVGRSGGREADIRQDQKRRHSRRIIITITPQDKDKTKTRQPQDKRKTRPRKHGIKGKTRPRQDQDKARQGKTRQDKTRQDTYSIFLSTWLPLLKSFWDPNLLQNKKVRRRGGTGKKKKKREGLLFEVILRSPNLALPCLVLVLSWSCLVWSCLVLSCLA